MENTERVLFDDTTPQWYVAVADKWIGPMSASDVYKKIVSGEITWAHFVWKPGQSEWKRLCDVKTFQAAVPQTPPKSLTTEIKETSKPTIKAGSRKSPSKPPAPPKEEKKWYLYYNDSQFGPFTQEDVDRFLKIGKIHERVHAWCEGMENWERLERIDIFVDAAGNARKRGTGTTNRKLAAPSNPEDLRASPRRPLVARILMANRDSVTTAVCRDISVGGMQVLTDHIPGNVGTRVRMNVSAEKFIAPFVAEGVIVRILEDGRGFAFRFDRLSDEAKRALENYIQSAS